MKNLLLFVLFFAPLAAWDSDVVCEVDNEDEFAQREIRQGVPEYVQKYSQYEASWPTKDTDPLIESLKN